MQIYSNPFDNKANRNNVRSNQTLMKGMQALSKNQSTSNVKQAISTLVKGQVIKGLVLDVSNKQVVLQTDNGERLEATVKEAVDLNIGEQLYFEVKDDSSNQIQLRPLTNPNINPQNATLEKVLNSNGLMLNEKNLSIVSELMDQGMNLDDATIRTIIRNSTKFPQASIKSLVLMEKLQLPVNETTLSQLAEYEEGNGMILKQTEDFIHQFCEELQSCKDSKGFEEVSKKLSQIMKETDSSVTKETQVLQKIHQTIENAGTTKDIKLLQNINDIIKNEYSGQAEHAKAENVAMNENASSVKNEAISSDNIKQTPNQSQEASVIQKGLMVNHSEGFGIINETKEAQILGKINQILLEEYPKQVNDAKSEVIIQKVQRESQTEHLQEANLKMTPETKDAQVLQKITQIIQKEYLGEIKDAKGESFAQKNIQAGKSENVQNLAESKEVKILNKINQLIQNESGTEANFVKGESFIQKGQVEQPAQNLHMEQMPKLPETKAIEVIQKIHQIIKEEQFEEVKATKDESMLRKEQLNQNQNVSQNDHSANETKDATLMQKSTKVLKEESVRKMDELILKVSKEVKDENLGAMKETRILQKLNEAVHIIENQANSKEMIKGTPITIRFNQLIQKENPVTNKENQMIQKFEQIVREENLGTIKENELIQKLTDIVKNQNSDETQMKATEGKQQIQTNDIMQKEQASVAKEAQLIQKINQLIQVETENSNFVQSKDVESLLNEIKQMIQEASLEGNSFLNETLNQNENLGNHSADILNDVIKNPLDAKKSLFFEEFDASKLLEQTSSKTVEFMLSSNGTFQDVLDSFIELANQPFLKGQISQEDMQQITDIYTSNLPKEEMVSKIEEVLMKSSNMVMGESIETTNQDPKQTAQKLVDFMEQAEILKDLPKDLAQKSDVMQKNSYLKDSQMMNQNGNQNQFHPTANLVSQKLESELSALREFFQSRGFNDIVKGALQERWYVEPEDLKDDFKVKEQIRKIGNDLNKISQFFEKEGGFQKTAQLSNQIKDNIDFMNQVNQYYNYVQIPLKLTEQLTNSELYVYTNKKNLKNKEGQISVLLHLDMKNLGSTDIHVALTNQSIHTRFYLEDDDSMKILEQNVQELEIAIQKLGYSMSYEMNVREQMPSFSENLLEEKPKTDIKRYNFDVRM